MPGGHRKHPWKGYYRNYLAYSPRYVDKKDNIGYGRSTKFSDLLAMCGSKRMTGYITYKSVNNNDDELWLHVLFQDFYNLHFWGREEISTCEKFYHNDVHLVEPVELSNSLTRCDYCLKTSVTTWSKTMMPSIYLRRLNLKNLSEPISQCRLCLNECVERISVIDVIFTLKLSEWCGIPYIFDECGEKETAGEKLRETIQHAKIGASSLLKRKKSAEKCSKKRQLFRVTESDLGEIKNIIGPLSLDFFDTPIIGDLLLTSVKSIPLIDFTVYNSRADVNEAHFCAVNRKIAESFDEFLEIYDDVYFLLKRN